MIVKVDVTLGSAAISPFSGSGILTKLFVGNPEGYKTKSAVNGEARIKATVEARRVRLTSRHDRGREMG